MEEWRAGRAFYRVRATALQLQRVSSMRELSQTHALIEKSGIADHPSLLLRLLNLTALSPWGSLHDARSLFDSSRNPSPPHFNTMIRAYSRSIFPAESLFLFNLMCRRGLPSDNFTLPFVLKACGRASDDISAPVALLARKGAEVHCRAFHLGLNHDPFVQNSLIFMYSNCGRLDSARRVFDGMPDRAPASWNAMAAAYDRHGDPASAEMLFCSMPEKNVVSWNSAITRYVRSGDVDAAWRVFEVMPVRDAVSWNSMIAGYTRVGNYKHSLMLFRQMQAEEVEPTELTIVSVLGACAETGGLDMGREVHLYLRERKIKIEGYVGTALLDMYAKCGRLKLARQVFDAMQMKHISCWNAMIVALAVHGQSEEALELFYSLEKEWNGATTLNRVTFLGVLLACSHKGLVDEGKEFFRRMVEDYRITPDIKHYGCMVDLLSRFGHLSEAYRMIKEMPVKANSVMWKTMLGACRIHGDVELAEEAFRELAALEPLSDGDYVLMSNIYAEAGKWEDVECLRCGMVDNSILKQPGSSQIELK